MTRRIIAIIATAALAFALLPASVGFASAAASASLDAASRTVFPGARTVQVTVTNNEVGPLGTAQLATPIDLIRVILPHQQGVTLGGPVPVPEGWEVVELRRTNAQEVIYHSGTLNGQSSITLDIPTSIARPANSDRNAPWRVMVSSDDGETMSTATANPAGSLDQLIQILQVFSGTVISPALAADGTATGGQAVTYGVFVRNHAAEAVNVESALNLSGGDSLNGEAPGPAVIDPAVTREHRFDWPLLLGNVTSGQQNRTYGTDANKVGGGATATDQNFSYLIQARPRLDFANGTFRPQYVKSVDAPGDPVSYVFNADFTRANLPTATVNSCSIAFADTIVDCVDPPTWPDGSARTITTAATTVTGPDDDYQVLFEFNITDGNGFTFDHDAVSNQDAVTIDSLRPIIANLDVELPDDADGDQQEQVKDGDLITITGDVSDENPDPDAINVRLVQSNGEEIIVPQENISTSSTGTGLSFTATINPTFDPGAASFHVQVEAVDLAMNVSEPADTITDPVFIDRVIPSLDTFERNVTGFTTREYSDEAQISAFALVVQIDEDFVVQRGCNTGHWRTTGNSDDDNSEPDVIVDVQYANGDRCASRDAKAEDGNLRVLLLQGDREEDYETTVIYDPEPPTLPAALRDPLKDGAGRFIEEPELQDIQAFVPPGLPTLDAVKRNNGEEDATLDEGFYWTRFGGDDLTIHVIEGVRTGYRLCVYDTGGSQLRCSEAASQNSEELDVAVPIGDVPDGEEATFTRFVRFVNAHGILGEAEELNIALDKITPTIASATRVGDEVEVNFNDVIWGGSNAAFLWGIETHDGEQGYNGGVTSVTGSRETRTLQVDWPPLGDFHSVNYDFEGRNTGRQEIYVDRAGNQVPGRIDVSAS